MSGREYPMPQDRAARRAAIREFLINEVSQDKLNQFARDLSRATLEKRQAEAAKEKAG